MDNIEKNCFIVLLLPLPILFIYMIYNDAKAQREYEKQHESTCLKYENSGHIRKYFDKNFNLVYYKSEATYYREAYYLNGTICVDSLVRDYYKSSEKLQFEGHLKSESPDIVTGKCIWYYENGNISSEVFYDNDGLTQGISISYYEDGTKEFESCFVNGKREGKLISYHPNGKIRLVSNYKNDKPEGLSTFYYENGKIKETRTYKNNTLTGEWKTFYENGRLKSKGQAENGKKIGIWEYYDLNGYISYRNESNVYYRPTYISKSQNSFSSLLSECEELSDILEEADIDHEEPSSSMDYHELQNLRDEYESLLEDNNIDY